MTVKGTKELILDKAATYLKRDGYEKASMQGLAQEADLAVEEVYSNFASKNEVVNAVFRVESKKLEQRLRKAVAGKPHLLEQLQNYFQEFGKSFFNMVNDYKLYKDEILANGTIVKFFDSVVKEQSAFLRHVFQEGIKNGQIDRIRQEDVDWFAEYAFASFLSEIEYNYELDKPLAEQELTKRVSYFVPRLLA